jgi:hypothetical protein
VIVRQFRGISASNSTYQKRDASENGKRLPPNPAERRPKTTNLEIISGFNPSVIEELNVPDHVIIGGCNGETNIEQQICIGIYNVTFGKKSMLAEIHDFSPPAFQSIRIPAKVKVIEETAFVGAISEKGMVSCSQELFKLEAILGVHNCPRLSIV